MTDADRGAVRDGRRAVAAGRGHHWLARLLARSAAVRRILRQVVWADGTLEILEEGSNSAAVQQMSWARALERGSSLPLFVPTPASMTPENFVSNHMPHCRCVFWHWFLAQGIEKQTRTVLDVGCGLGYTTHHFLTLGCHVTGVTCNPHEKDECLRRGIKVLDEDFHFLSAADDSFDLVFSSHSLEHSISPLFALWEWKRVVRPGSHMMIVIPMPIEQDARAAYPDHYDPATDTMSFPSTGEGHFSVEEGGTAASTHNMGLHPFVLSYWQLRWLFYLAGLTLVAEGAEDPIAGELRGAEEIAHSIGHDPRRLRNALFLLRKPEPTTP